MAETPHFQFRESGFNPWSANQIPPAATWHSQIDKLNRLKSNNPLRQRGGKGKGELNSNSNIPKVTFPGLRQIPRTSSLLASKAHCCKVLQLEFYMSLHAGTSALEKSLAFLLFYFIFFLAFLLDLRIHLLNYPESYHQTNTLEKLIRKYSSI